MKHGEVGNGRRSRCMKIAGGLTKELVKEDTSEGYQEEPKAVLHDELLIRLRLYL